jgi:acetyl-CoA synthetase
MSDAKSNIESSLQEKRVFKPADAFSAKAHIQSLAAYEALSKQAEADPESFWAGIASELHWFEKWNKVLEWDLPFSKWFVGGKTNIAYNCLDRHLTTPRKNKVAILWEGEPGDVRALSYQMLHREVSRFANVLKALGMKKGDRATVYMGMVPELAIALLACARIGVAHNVVFGGFSAEALRDRINDSK